MLSNKKPNDTVKETFYGYIENTRDSLLLFEACKRGILPRVTRRLQDRERYLIRSGSVFCFDENESGIKRWTDGFVWSPSRILGNFLIYREMDDKKSTRNSLVDEYGMKQNGVKNNFNFTSNSNCTSLPPTTNEYMGTPNLLKIQREKALIGSLKNSSKFKRNGLIKKSMSLIVDGVQQHIVSYYSKDDVLSNKLKTPSSILELSSLEVSPGLRLRQNFRVPLFSNEESSDDSNSSRFTDDYQGQYTSAKRKYSDITQQSFQEDNSSSSSFSPSSSVSNSSPYSVLHSQPFLVEPSIINTPNNSLLLVNKASNNCYASVKPDSTSSVQQTHSHVNNITKNIHHHAISTQNVKGSVEQSNFDRILSPQDQLCINMSKEKEKMNKLENTVLHGALVATTGLSIENEPAKRNLDVINCNSDMSFVKEYDKPCKSNITTAQSFVNIERASRTITTPTSSYCREMSLDFNSGSSSANAFQDYVVPKGSYYSPSHFDGYHQEQNPHHHLFSSSSFHAINHAAIPYRAELATNSFMLDMNALLGTGWNEFELQM